MTFDHSLQTIVFFPELDVDVDDLVKLLSENFETSIFFHRSNWSFTKLLDDSSEFLLFSSYSRHLIFELLYHRSVLFHALAVVIVHFGALRSTLFDLFQLKFNLPGIFLQTGFILF